jgi:hypothetical protein
MITKEEMIQGFTTFNEQVEGVSLTEDDAGKLF